MIRITALGALTMYMSFYVWKYLSLVSELRKATIPMFFDMMHVEFTQPVPNSNRLQGNFHQVKSSRP